MPTPLQLAAQTTQFVFLGAGLYVLWAHVLSPAARARRLPPRLLPWQASTPEFVLLILHAVFGAVLGSFLLGLLSRSLGLSGDQLAIAATAALHFGALVGLALHFWQNPAAAPRFTGGLNILAAGFATFLAALPIVVVTAFAWQQFLKLLGHDVAHQPAVQMLARLSTSPWLAIFIVFAVIVAPITEELIFRAGLFRYFRTRQKRLVALLAPALVFAAIHAHLPTYLPLAVLGIVFALGYERTGAIGTSIVAHALFNLNNLFMLLLGAGETK